MRRVLLITYFFPPLNNVASLRTYSFARYLAAAGNRVTVLIPRHIPGGRTDDLRVDASGFTVVEADWVSHGGAAAELADVAGHGVRAWLRGLLRRLKHDWCGNILTSHDFWFPAAYRSLRQLLSRECYDVIISSHSPISCHLLGRIARNALPDACWMADYRDLWSCNHFAAPPRFPFNLLQLQIEKRLSRAADYLTTVSAPLADQLRKTNERPTIVIENGYFPEDCPSSHDARPADGKLRLVYTGLIYQEQYDVAPLFAAINLLLQAGEVGVKQLELCFYGANSTVLADTVSAFGLGDSVRLMHSVSRDESLAVQRSADALIFLGKESPRTIGVLTGKIFEYMVAGPPIIAVGISTRNLAGQLIEESGTGFVCHNDPEEIATALRQVLAGSRPTPQPDVIDRYRRDRLVQRLLEAIEQCFASRRNA